MKVMKGKETTEMEYYSLNNGKADAHDNQLGVTDWALNWER